MQDSGGCEKRSACTPISSEWGIIAPTICRLPVFCCQNGPIYRAYRPSSMLAGETAGGMVECYPCPTSGHVRLYVALEGSRGRIRLARKMKGGSSVALIGFLILFPLLVAGVLLLVGNETARRVIVCSSADSGLFGWYWPTWARRGSESSSLQVRSISYARSSAWSSPRSSCASA